MDYQIVSEIGGFASAADLLTLDDRPQVALSIPRWHANGQPLRLLVRALSLDQQEVIQRTARRKDKLTGQVTSDRVLFVAETLRLAFIQPQLDSAQAMALAAKNPTILEAIVDFIWGALGHLDFTAIAALVAAEAELEQDDAGDTDSADDGALA